MPRPAYPAQRASAAAVVALVALLASSGGALAHDNLVQATPAANSSLDSPPGQISLSFSERPEVKLSRVQVFNTERQRIDDGPLTASPRDASTLIERLKPGLPRGVYAVSWQTTSALDGHVTGGTFAFGIGVAPSPADIAAPAAPLIQSQGWADAAIRWLGYVAIVALAGLVLFEPAVLRPALAAAPPEQRWEGQLQAIRQRRLAAGRLFGGLAVLAALGAILGQASRSSALDVQAILETSFGQLLLARLIVAVAIFGLLAMVGPWASSTRHRSLGAAAAIPRPAWAINPEFQQRALTALLLAELLLFAATSHALGARNAPQLALFVDWVHLTLAGVWVGGLITLALLLGPLWRARIAADDAGSKGIALFPAVLRQFSRLALIATAGIALTGAYQAFIHVGSFDNVLTTEYGRALVVKTSIFAAALALAALHRFLLLPALGRTRGPSALLNRTLPLEATLGIAILAAAGVLMGLAPANEETDSGRLFTKSLGDVQLSLQVLPLRVGPNTFQISLRKGGQPVTDADKVEIQLQHAEMDMGVSVVDLNNVGGGVYSANSDALSMSGPWRADMLVRLPGQLDQRPEFDINVSSRVANGASAPRAAPVAAGAPASSPPPAAAPVGTSQSAAINSALPQPGDLTLGGDAGSTLVGLTLRPGKPGLNNLLLYVLPPDGENASGSLPVSLAINGSAIPVRQCASTCRSAQVQLQGLESVHVTVGGKAGGAADFSLPSLPTAPGDELFQRMSARMHQLRTLRVDETISPPVPPVRTTYAFQAPDRMQFQIANSRQAIFIGATHYDREDGSSSWKVEPASSSVKVPYFIWDEAQPQPANVVGGGNLGGVDTQAISFFELLGRLPVWFRVSAGADGLAYGAQMRAPGHFMDHRYYDFDAPMNIQPPALASPGPG